MFTGRLAGTVALLLVLATACSSDSEEAPAEAGQPSSSVPALPTAGTGGGTAELDVDPPADGSGDTALSAALCEALDPAATAQELSSLLGQPLPGQLLDEPEPVVEGPPGQAQFVATCTASLTGGAAVDLSDCAEGVTGVRISLQDFDSGPAWQELAGVAGQIRVEGATPQEFIGNLIAVPRDELLSGAITDDPVPGLDDASFAQDIAGLSRALPSNNQLVSVSLDGSVFSGEGCGTALPFLIGISDRVLAAAASLDA